MPLFPYAQHGRVTDEHLVFMDAVVTYFTELYLPTFLFCQISTLHIIEIYSKDIFLDYELSLPFQWFSSVFLQVLSTEDISCFCYYHSCCRLLFTGSLCPHVHRCHFTIMIGKGHMQLVKVQWLEHHSLKALLGFVLAFILGKLKHLGLDAWVKDRIIQYNCIQIQHLNISQKKLELLQTTFIISFEGQLGSVLNFKLSDAKWQLLHDNKHRLSHWMENNHIFTLENIF